MAQQAPGTSPTTLVFARCDVQAYRFGRSLGYYAREYLRLNSLPNTSSAAIRTASFNLANESLSLKNRTLSPLPLNVLTQTIASIVSQNADPTDQSLMLPFIKGNFADMSYPTGISALRGTAGDFTTTNTLFLYGNDGTFYWEGNIGQQEVVSASVLSNENMWVSSERGNITIGGAARKNFNMSAPFTINLNPGSIKIRVLAACYLPFDADLLEEARLGYDRFKKYAIGTLGGQFYLPISIDTLIVSAYKQNRFQTHVPAILIALFSAYEVVSRCY
uniref:Uncharacterized protein n=1 Tax=viral metagenome TaxID=1070528 RepID=A0A2V0RIP2_9ZZZZ